MITHPDDSAATQLPIHIHQIDIWNPPPTYSFHLHSTNTLSRRPIISQIAAYALILALPIAFYICIIHIYLNLPIIIVFSISWFLTIAYGTVASLQDPTDSSVYFHKWQSEPTLTAAEKILISEKIKATDYYQNNIKADSIFCEDCDALCSRNSKHCRPCNRCVYQFDHHCIWLNNCIGHENYRSFFILLIAITINIVTFQTAGALMTAKAIKDEQLQQVFSYTIPVWIIMGFAGLFGLFVFSLLIFHIFLSCKGITTYTFLFPSANSKNTIHPIDREAQKSEKVQEKKKKNMRIGGQNNNQKR